jgi:hypothetical protein
MDSSKLKILKKSLLTISEFVNDITQINSGEEFIKIHKRNIEMLNEYGRRRKSSFIKTSILKYPNISVEEVEQYILNEKKEISIIRLFGGVIIDFFYRLIKTKGITSIKIKQKLDEIKYLNERLYKVIDDPIYESVFSRIDGNGTD